MGMLKKYKITKGRWINLDWDHINADEVKAGMPIGEDGQIHNDGSAVGILLKSCDRLWNCKGEILIEGQIYEAERRKMSGIVLSNTCRKALVGISLDACSLCPVLECFCFRPECKHKLIF